MNQGQSKIRFRLTRWGSDYRIKVLDEDPKGQVRKREGNHDKYHVHSWGGARNGI